MAVRGEGTGARSCDRASHSCHLAVIDCSTLGSAAGYPPMSGRILGRFLALGTALVLLCIVAGCGGAHARKAAHMEKGRQYLAAQKYEKARIEFRNALQIDPKDAGAYFETGVAEEKLEHLPQAAQAYQGAIDLAPQHDYLEASVALAKLMALYGAP